VFSNEVNHQQLHHFLYQSPWDAEDVMDAVAHSFVDLVEAQGLKDSLNLIIDESAFSKKGQHSAGVTRQYNGNRGKIDNLDIPVILTPILVMLTPLLVSVNKRT
jgi:SRSO17 transposase